MDARFIATAALGAALLALAWDATSHRASAQDSVAATSTTGAATNDPLMASVIKKVHDKFILADKNHDGELTLPEAKHGHMSFTVRHFQRIDTHHVGHVSEREIEGYMVRRMRGAGA